MQMNWKCPYCGQSTTITDPNYSNGWMRIRTDLSSLGDCGVRHTAYACPNPDCKSLTLEVELCKIFVDSMGNWCAHGEPHLSWNLLPESSAKPQPDYIPEEIRKNYYEAARIASLSPKASASLARRCLQGMVRDFWDIPQNKRGNLGAEINYVQDRLSQDIWQAIQDVRSVGDVGAHMDKDVNLIVDIEPGEAELLLRLIETLLEEWYVALHERTQRLGALSGVAKNKLEIKKAAKKQAKSEGAQKQAKGALPVSGNNGEPG
ncbi:MAG: DUF4145 domain-containing protein [Methyloceanibacter sp.]